MPEPSTDRQEYLDCWLRQATKGLCAKTQARIHSEVSAHFDDALAEALAAGLAESKAAHAAFVALGDPREARRYFSKTFQNEDGNDLTTIKYYRGFYPFKKDLKRWIIAGALQFIVVVFVFFLMSNKDPKSIIKILPVSPLIFLPLLVMMRDKLLAHFLFASVRKEVEWRFAILMFTGRALLNFILTMIFIGCFIYMGMTEFGHIHLKNLVIAMFLAVFLNGLLILRDFRIAIPLRRKILEMNGKNEKPEWERYA